MKLCALVAFPPEVTTVSGPVCAQAGTFTVNVPSAWGVAGAVLAAGQPVNSTLAPPGVVRFVPVRVTSVPIGPLVGVNPLRVGADAAGVGVGDGGGGDGVGDGVGDPVGR